MNTSQSTGLSEIHRLSFNNDDIILVPEVSIVPNEEIRRLDCFAFVLCTKGHSTAVLEEHTLNIQADDLLLGTPSLVISKSQTSNDFACCCMALSIDYAKRIFPYMRKVLDFKFLLEKAPLIHLEKDAIICFKQYFDLLCYKVSQTDSPRKDVINFIMLAFIYDFEHIIEGVIQSSSISYSSAENLFRRFIELITLQQPKPRMVQDYAEKLCVTPKYLSSVCKQISGKAASALIDAYVMKDVEYQLKYTKKSIKEISMDLGFPNISFFGKYVKKHLGDSPKEVRKRFAKEA